MCFAKLSPNVMKFRKIQTNVVKILCVAKFSSNFAKCSLKFTKFREFQIILSKCCVSRNLHNAVSQQPYVGVEVEEGGSGGGPARIALRTLPANADCAYIGIHL